MHRDNLPLCPPEERLLAGHQAYPVTRCRAANRVTDIEAVAEEVPVALVYNGISHAVMLASPLDLEAFAIGFSLTEGIIRDLAEVYDLEVMPQCDGIEVHLTIASERMMALKEKRRSLTGRTGCGICGAESLGHAVRHPQPVAADGRIHGHAIERAFREIGDHQQLHQLTGAVHGAGWVDLAGQVQWVREDVGRHNALDKLIGTLLYQKIDPSSGFAVVTSRASYEMVQKAASAGIFILAAISAPTGLAIRLAAETGVTLIGFARQGRYVVYAHPERLIQEESKE